MPSYTLYLLSCAVIAALVPAAGTTALAAEDDIEEACQSLHPRPVYDYLARRGCVQAETRKRREEQESHAREEKARPCIADDLPRMEDLAAKVRAAVKPSMQLNEVQAALTLVLGTPGENDPATDDIKERVVVHKISTKCNSAFHFLINVRADRQGELRWLRVWSHNAPTGYQSGLDQRYTNDFESQRLQEQYQRSVEEEAVKRAQEQRMREIAAKEFENRQQNALRSMTISNQTATCTYFAVYLGEACKTVRFDLAVTNGSREVITAVSFGWIFLQEPGARCPMLSAKTTMNLRLQPGETTGMTFLAYDGPVSSTINYCLSATGVAVAP